MVSRYMASCCHTMRNIAKMKQFLSEKQMQIIVQSLVLSTLDYCNSLYYGANNSVIKQLQVLQNRACRIIKGLKKRESVEDHMKDLHWLRIPERIEFKILLITFKAIIGQAPKYLTDLLQFNSNGSRDVSLYCPVNLSAKAFATCAPRLWNDLPSDVKKSGSIEVFKSRLKAHLFRKSYNLY